MYLIDGPDAVPVKPAKKPAETAPGWFDGGDPLQNLKATMVTRDWLNTLQSELKNAIEEAGLTLDRNDDSQLVQAIKKLVVAVVNLSPEIHIETVPVGTIIAYHGAIAPEGYLACDGSDFDLLVYPQLYALLGKSTVPDLRGCFLRGTGGNAAALGVRQEDAGRNVTGKIGQDGGYVSNPYVQAMGEAFDVVEGCFRADVVTKYNVVDAGSASSSIANLWIDASRNWGATHTADEFRPVNVAVLHCIKHD